MRPLTQLEKILIVLSSVGLLFLMVYYWLGVGQTLTDLQAKRDTLATLSRQYESGSNRLRLYPHVIAQYEEYGTYSLPVREGVDPSDDFSNFVNAVIRDLAPQVRPRLQPTDIDEIVGVENYEQILLPIEFDTTLPVLVELLRTFDHQRLLIRELEVSCPVDREPNLSVKLTLSRFVPVRIEGEDEESEGGAGS